MKQDDSITSVGPFPSRVANRARWGPIFGGVLIAAGVWTLLHLAGMGIGLTAIDPHDARSLRGISIGTGVWSLIAPILALFVGGLATGRLAGVFGRASAAIHGAVVWSLATVAAVTLMWLTLGAVVGGVVKAGATMAASAGAAVERPDDIGDGMSLEALGLSSRDLVAPINQRLQAEGKPPVTPEQLSAAAREAIRRGVRDGQVDRRMIIGALAERTPLTATEAGDIAAQIEARQAGLMTQMRETALMAAEGAGKALLGLSLAMLLGLAAAVGGALVGARHVQNAQKRAARVVAVYPTPEP